MDLISRIVRVVTWGIVTGGLLSFARQWNSSGGAVKAEVPESRDARIRLQRDPVCATYISPEISYKLEQSGRIVHFCSAECRALYAQAVTQAPQP